MSSNFNNYSLHSSEHNWEDLNTFGKESTNVQNFEKITKVGELGPILNPTFALS